MHLLLTVEFVLGLLTGLVLVTSGAEAHLWDSWSARSDEVHCLGSCGPRCDSR
jgi:hypothetical protein